MLQDVHLADEQQGPEPACVDVLVRGVSIVRTDDEVPALGRHLIEGLPEHRRRSLRPSRDQA